MKCIRFLKSETWFWLVNMKKWIITFLCLIFAVFPASCDSEWVPGVSIKTCFLIQVLLIPIHVIFVCLWYQVFYSENPLSRTFFSPEDDDIPVEVDVDREIIMQKKTRLLGRFVNFIYFVIGTFTIITWFVSVFPDCKYQPLYYFGILFFCDWLVESLCFLSTMLVWIVKCVSV
jgi:hypothetical protein